MSYEKATKRNNRHNKACQPVGFSPLGPNQRRKEPWLGGGYYEPGMEEARDRAIKAYHAETERLLQENPNLELV